MHESHRLSGSILFATAFALATLLLPHSSPAQGTNARLRISAGRWHTLSARSDGMLWNGGMSWNSQLGHDETTSPKAPVWAMGPTNIVAAAWATAPA